jgi:hypothetical protein
MRLLPATIAAATPSDSTITLKRRRSPTRIPSLLGHPAIIVSEPLLGLVPRVLARSHTEQRGM